MSILEEMASAVIKRDVGACVDLANQIINEGIDPLEAIQEGFAKGMETVGRNFESGKFYLPEMILAAKAMNAGIDVLKPVIASKSLGKFQDKGKVVLATVQGDMHDIGKNILKLIMSTSGFEVIDLGNPTFLGRFAPIVKDLPVNTVLLDPHLTAISMNLIGAMAIVFGLFEITLENASSAYPEICYAKSRPVTQHFRHSFGL